MSFTPAHDVSSLASELEFAAGNYIAEPVVTICGEGFEYDPPDVEFSPGAYIADPVVTMNGECQELVVPTEWGDHYTRADPSRIMMGTGVVKHVCALAPVPDDNAQEIGIGYVVDFTAIPRTIKKGRPVTFRDATLGPEITEWLWHYGDGTTGTTDPSTHRYSTTGWKDIRLDVWSAGGEFASLLKRAYVYVTSGGSIICYW